MQGKRILLIVGGGIAAYKACELVRLIRKSGGSVRCVLTAGGAQFITPMTLAALSEQQVFTSLFDLKDEVEMGHIQLSREADLVVVAPATADLMAKMAGGIADDLATTLLLATDKKALAAPAMNVRMWQHEATKRNVARLRADGVIVLEPDEGEMACGEYGPGRLPEPEAILAAIEAALGGPGPPGARGQPGQYVRIFGEGEGRRHAVAPLFDLAGGRLGTPVRDRRDHHRYVRRQRLIDRPGHLARRLHIDAQDARRRLQLHRARHQRHPRAERRQRARDREALLAR